MSLKGKLVETIGIKCGGDVFNDMFRYRPSDISKLSPSNVQACNIRMGEFGNVGSVIFWNYTLDGKARVAKAVIKEIDEGNKSITYQVIEGDLMDSYKCFFITHHVDTTGENNLVTWTFDFEKINSDSPNPITLMKMAIGVTKDIEAYHIK